MNFSLGENMSGFVQTVTYPLNLCLIIHSDTINTYKFNKYIELQYYAIYDNILNWYCSI